MNLFELFYNSGGTFDECLVKGPGTLGQVLAECTADELRIQARRLAITGREMKGLEPGRLTAVIVDRVLAVVSHGREIGEQLCRQALDQLNMIKAAELAEINLQNCRQELEDKYDIPFGRCREGVKASA